MALSTQILGDGEAAAVIKVWNDGTDPAGAIVVDVSTLQGATGDGTDRVVITSLKYVGAYAGRDGLLSANPATLSWDGSTDSEIISLPPRGSVVLENLNLTNNAPGATGNLTIDCNGGTYNFTLIISVNKRRGFEGRTLRERQIVPPRHA